MSDCRVHNATFDRTQFVGDAWFVGVEFSGLASFFGDTPADYQMDPIEGPSFKDVRFRVCNMNTATGYIGTCGSS